ncbi:MAG: hypothetical protein M3Y12_11585 [Bacteroidota bacterium]|nr:hypothetical protein [Bacteroidota bacterium]
MKAFFGCQYAFLRVLFVAAVAAVALPGAAQTPGDHAEIFAVLGAGKGGQFSLPQVRLADEATAARINRAIARAVLSAADEPVDTTVTLARQLRQLASQPCCLRGARFQTLLNQGSLLSLKLTLEINGAYAYQRAHYLVFDLVSGQRLHLSTLVADSPAQLEQRLGAAVNRRLGEFLGDSAALAPARRADLADRFGWDGARRRVRFSTAAAPTKAPALSLDEFALTTHALLLFYRVGLPATMLADTPDEAYRFPYNRLQTRGRLAELILKGTSGTR